MQDTITIEELTAIIANEVVYEEHESIIDKYNSAKLVWSSIFAQYIEDCKFANGDQWDLKLKKQRDENYLQSLIYNQVSPKITQIVNNARKAAPNIKCSPVGGGAHKNTAKVYDGIIKRIQYNSNANSTYSNALKNVITGGLGAWKIDIDESEEIKIERIKDPTKIIIDPTSDRVDFSDAEYIFELKWITKKYFEELFGEEDIAGMGKTDNYDMFTKDSVLILDYWCKHSNGKIFKYIVNGEKILKTYEWIGMYIPIVYVTGEEVYIEDSREYKGIIRDIKDIQRLLNLSKSRTADYLQRSSVPQWLASEDAIAGNVAKWNKDNVNGDPVLTYAEGTTAPQRLDAPSPPVGFQSVSQEAENDIRSAIGVRDQSQDLPDGISSKTMELHIAQSNIGTYGYFDSIDQAIKYTGQIIVDLIPKVYTEPKIMEIMGLDGNVSTVQINQPYIENGQQVEHNLASGKYSVIIGKGPSFESQRDEALDKMMELVKITPEFMSTAGDIIFRNMDFEGAEEIADRLKAQIPPNILAASNPTNGDNQTQILQNNMNQMQQQMQLMNEQNQQMQAIIQQMTQEKAAKLAEISAKAQADLQIKQLEFQHDIKLKQMDIDGKSSNIAEAGIVDRDNSSHNAELQMGMKILDSHDKIFHRKMDKDMSNDFDKLSDVD